jgi:hypothetical protein
MSPRHLRELSKVETSFRWSKVASNVITSVYQLRCVGRGLGASRRFCDLPLSGILRSETAAERATEEQNETVSRHTSQAII